MTTVTAAPRADTQQRRRKQRRNDHHGRYTGAVHGEARRAPREEPRRETPHSAQQAPEKTFEKLRNGFSDLGLSPALVYALARAGLNDPKPIQTMAIPAQLEGADILGLAQTGSGKTAAFGLPIIQGISALRSRPSPKTTRALILAPTRELAAQIEDNLLKFAAGSRLSTALVLGGASRGGQISKLRRGVDIVIATPGRLLDLINDGHLSLDETRWFVLDEADRMLDMGFIEPVREIARLLPIKHQTAFFSATMPKAVEGLAASLLNDPVTVEADRKNSQPAVIAQSVLITPTSQKRAKLAEILGQPEVTRTLVFARTKHGADRIVKDLGHDGFRAEAIHGNKNQNARQRALQGFRDGKLKILVATDIAARGIDVPCITHVVNFDLPDEPENYVHRIGRTGRNGETGVAITLCDHAERGKLRAIERAARVAFRLEGAFDESVPLMERGKNRGKGHKGGGGGSRGGAEARPRRKKPSTHRKGPSPRAKGR
ncbi:MAG: DEAD/DEAH box helicase [Pseudomonadota bacterium]|nr:DEAD/DEAH box helicase [Pseudomonadota bacterium]